MTKIKLHSMNENKVANYSLSTSTRPSNVDLGSQIIWAGTEN